ncbi:TetR/AcrR family transcriptional regulator [Streptomyces turgidiscabies]|uniref:Transcriptional regulator, TetR family n=1 Tax=Streptomyces turgidiscabies (strain Car8) TaxID=698760 RepID=L7FD15_STRT8|nr:MULTISPECIES: TetR/AcrR family transcriptional regulator C-terminal domain-containing protein [Streptomyces]ELP69044.1 transcriptional regulator, TetR family [Streptomyces turgidiscabies Car8]MDX3498244.1 TetR/AcrR family transcriptional regulator C-terminal domain-containing protein [Streptomyces turgidiscabies]GAQ75217.1 tetracycline repressor protein class G [Streptomyces turgidiscabies]
MRRSPGRPPVPFERIVAAAVQIVDEEGADALSMRTLAQRLGSGTATLYRHFDNRAALVAHVVDRMFGGIEITDDEFAAMGWRGACRTGAQAMFDAVSRHENVAPLLVEGIPVGPNAMAVRERCIAVLLADGFPPKVAAYAYATLSRYVLGFAIQVRGHHGVDQPGGDAQASAAFRAADPSLYPATAAVADWLPVPLEEEFRFGLELLLDGLGRLRDAD